MHVGGKSATGSSSSKEQQLTFVVNILKQYLNTTHDTIYTHTVKKKHEKHVVAIITKQRGRVKCGLSPLAEQPADDNTVALCSSGRRTASSGPPQLFWRQLSKHRKRHKVPYNLCITTCECHEKHGACVSSARFGLKVGRQSTFEKPAPQEKHMTCESDTLSPEYTRNKEAPSPHFFFFSPLSSPAQ